MTATADAFDIAPAVGAVLAHPRWKKCHPSERDARRIADALRQLPGAMAGQFHNLNIKPLAGTRVGNLYRLRVGAYRIVYTVGGGEVLVLALQRRDDTTYADVDRFAILRHGSGLKVVEVAPAPTPGAPTVAGRAPRRLPLPEEHENPLTPFDHAQLRALRLDGESIEAVRAMRPSVELAEALADRGLPADVVELVGDAWNDRDRYLAIFGEGRTPTIDDARIDEAELAERVASSGDTNAIAELDERDFEAVLAGSIEVWMFYLHPSQARIARHPATGPSRVRGGPGTGKTVAALHRARHLVRDGIAERVLLTTFVSVLPQTWNALLERFAAAEAPCIDARTVDSLAMRIVTEHDGPVRILSEDENRAQLDWVLQHTPGLGDALGGVHEIGREFETVLAGRRIESLEQYQQLKRSGRGAALSAAQRRIVWSGYERYRERLRRDGRCTFAELRLHALALAEAGHGPRYDAIIVDEAQDLTEAQVRLLMALDARDDHAALMFVGDGQQSIYPGGFTLRSVGLDVRGRSFLLHTNWRNTQAIESAADAVIGDLPSADLDDELPARRDEGLPRRLGERPELHLVDDNITGDWIVAEIVNETLAGGLEPADIAVLGRKNSAWKRGEAALKRASIPTLTLAALAKDPRNAPDAVRVGTFERSKGLEFKLVILVGYARQEWDVKPYWLKHSDDKREHFRIERRKLFVAMTRARDRLALVASEPLLTSIEGARDHFGEWHWS